MRKPVYNERFYKIQALLKNREFKNDIQWLKDKFIKYDIPIPTGGFVKHSEYIDWNEKFWKVWSKQEQSPEVKKLWKKYADTKDNKIHSSEKYDDYEKEKTKLVLPVYGHYIRQIAQKHGFDFNDKDLHEFLTHYTFLGKTEITDPSLLIKHSRNKKTNKMEMYVRIFPWTTKDDLVKDWNFIRTEQEFYRNGQDRNQIWKNFERDYHIYELYEQARENKESGDKRRLEEITHSLYYAETKDDKMDLDNIKRIVHGVRKRLGLGDELPSDNS